METLALTSPDTFPAFPFVPYEIQLQLMQHLYENIESRRVTIVESPTGTGKTLSLLCASLTWLRDEQDRARRGKLLGQEQVSQNDWVLAQTLERKRRELEAEELEYAERLAKARKKEDVLKRAAKARVRKKLKQLQTDSTPDASFDFDDNQFLPDDMGSTGDGGDNLSPAVRALMAKLEKTKMPKRGDEADNSIDPPACTKIYYASRTHSQLAQVVHELEKLKISLSPVSVVAVQAQEPRTHVSSGVKRQIAVSDGEDEDHDEVPTIDVRAVSLGSRKQLCINEKLKSAAGDLDEACRTLLSEKGDRRCSYLPPVEDEVRVLDFRDQVLAKPKDIESLVESGLASHTCPYFGSRRAIAQAQLVLLPYNLLLQQTAREALGIDLTSHIVVIDEAHNLISTLLSLSTTSLTPRTLQTSLNQLNAYLERFRTRLSTEHALHLRRLVGLLEALARYIEEWGKMEERKKEQTEVVTAGELLRRLGRKAEGVNLLEIEQYLRSSKIARKISGYCTKAMEKAAGEDVKKLAKLARMAATTPPLHAVENFIVSLTESNDDGRVMLTATDGHAEIKYQHLNPATHFQDVVECARAVVLAGGTMSPISDVAAQLFSNIPADRLTNFSCGHIVPPSHLRTVVLTRGPRGTEFQFKFDKRDDASLIADLGQALLNFASVVPAGLVVFVPSYAFLRLVTNAWRTSGLLDKLGAKKKVFMEPQESADVDGVLREYAAAISASSLSTSGGTTKKGGALLFAVVGAKLSEGLNFADDLARAVLVVGLPFANLASPELRERMNYVNRRQATRPKEAGAKDAGTELYENMCMNAVNQSIGRAIRHRADWAALVLVDARYASPRIRGKLPAWIGAGATVTQTFGEAIGELGRFYRAKRA